MTINSQEREVFESYIFLPMVLTVLNRDLLFIKQSKMKLKKPYIHLIEKAMTKVHQDLRIIKENMQKNQMKVFQEEKGQVFTQYVFIRKGYEEKHNYFNPQIKNKVELLLFEYIQ